MLATRNRSATSVLILILAAVVGLPAIATAAPKKSEAQIKECRVGFAGAYKAGHWTPVWVDVTGADGLSYASHFDLAVNDSDGVPTIVSAAVPVSTKPGESATAELTTKIGRMGSRINLALRRQDTVIDRADLQPGANRSAGATLTALPAASELVVAIGTQMRPWEVAFPNRDAGSGHVARHIAHLDDIEEMPTNWVAYEAVDVLVIDGSDIALLKDLAADETRYAALVRWIELGGRVVILCGGEGAAEAIGDGGPLAALVPGKLAGVVGLPETGSLENFAGSDEAIAGRGRREAMDVPRLLEVEGNIEVYAGRRPTDLPLVVRAARGLGEVTFAGVDLNSPPLADWTGRSGFLQALLRPYLADDASRSASQTLVTRGYNDLSGALRQRLGGSFAGVAPVTFTLVTLLAIGYLLVLGPLDYLVVHRWLGRPLAAWITFPVIVLLFGGGALALVDWRNGSGGPRVNQLEIVDVDTIAGEARGTFWASVYSPDASEFELRLDVEVLADKTADAKVLLSSWVLPGAGIGGSLSGGMDLGIVRGGYRYSSDLSALENVPILAAGTKSILGRWTAPIGSVIAAQLTDEDGRVAGSIENRTGRELRNLRLFYNGWGYQLDSLGDGSQFDVGEELSPRLLKTIVTRDALGDTSPERNVESAFLPERASIEELRNLIMFFEAAGGIGFVQLPNRYQAYCDLSRLLELGRAILVAEVRTAGSRLVDDGSRVLGFEPDSAPVVYRFVLPVRKE